MKIPRYLQQEQFTDQSALVPQQQRIVSPLEIVGEGVAGILEQKEQLYIASESARAITKVSEEADTLEKEIANNEILDTKGIGDLLKQRVNQAFDTLQLSSKVRRAAQPRVEELLALKSIDLKNSIELQRGKIQVANVDNSLEELTKGMTDATTDAELGYYRDLIVSTVDSLEGTLVSPEQKNALIQNKLNQVHEARIARMLNTPGADPASAMKYLESKKGEMTSAAYEAQRTDIENKIQDLNERHSFLDIDEALRMAKDDGSISLSSVQQLIDQNKDQFNTTTLSYFQNKIDAIEAERKADTKELVTNLITRTMLTDPEKALRIAEEKKSVLGNVGYDDVVTRIAIAKNSLQKSDAERIRDTAQQLNESVLGMRIDRGEFDDLSDDQMKNFLESESVMNMTISPTAAGTLMDKWGRKLDKKAEDRIEIDKAQQKISAGIILDQKQTDLVYKTFTSINDPQSQNWMDQEVSFAAQTAKNIPTPWLDFTKSARLLSPTPDNMGTIDTAAEYVIKLNKENPGVAANIDKETFLLLPTYWDRAGKIPDMSPEKKAEVWANILKTQYSPNKDFIDKIASTSSFDNVVDTYWKKAWDWYGKFSQNAQPEYFRIDPKIPGYLKSTWQILFKEQLAATTGENGVPNFDRAAEYAYSQLFKDWGITEVYGNIKWQDHPIDQYLNKFGFTFTMNPNNPNEREYARFLSSNARIDIGEFIDAEILKDFNKNVVHPEMKSPGLGANYSFENPSLDLIEESQISLEYISGSEKDSKSGFPDYMVLIDGDAQPVEDGYLAIKGDELYSFLVMKKIEKQGSDWERARSDREILNKEMKFIDNVFLSKLPFHPGFAEVNQSWP